MKRLLVVFLVLVSLSGIVPIAHASDGRGDSVLFGDSTVISEEETTGDLVVLGGDLEIRGRVVGDVVSLGGKVTLGGEVTGDIVSLGGGVDLKSTSVIGGNLIVMGGLDKETGARIGGVTREIKPETVNRPSVSAPSNPGLAQPFNPLLDFVSRLVRIIVVTISLLAVSLLIVLFFPSQVDLVKETVKISPIWSASIGLLTVVVAIVLSPVLVISLLGIPLVPVLWLALTAGIFVGFVGLGQLVGERLFEAFRIRRSVPLVTILSGTFLLIGFVALLSGAFSNCLGIVAFTLVSMPGLGAVVLTRFGTMIPNLPR